MHLHNQNSWAIRVIMEKRHYRLWGPEVIGWQYTSFKRVNIDTPGKLFVKAA